ncbi:MAG: hypothetical protein HOK69_00185 [Gammaproteobacteria bacterium]|jgi:hypothetical protein|nr:hypothetical protein [Gammaproteobacteria bacterium]
MTEQQKPPRISPSQQKTLVQLRNGPVNPAGMNKLEIRTLEALVRKELAEWDGSYYRLL